MTNLKTCKVLQSGVCDNRLEFTEHKDHDMMLTLRIIFTSTHRTIVNTTLKNSLTEMNKQQEKYQLYTSKRVKVVLLLRIDGF